MSKQNSHMEVNGYNIINNYITIQVNIDSPNSTQDNSRNAVVKSKVKKPSFIKRLAGMFRASAEFLGSIDPNIIIMLTSMILGIRL